MNTSEIEKLLRQAPRPQPPPDLKEKLKSEIAAGPLPGPASIIPRGFGAWLRHWWPVLAPGAVSLACAAVLTIQHQQIRELRTALKAAPSAVAVTGEATALPGSATGTGSEFAASAVAGASNYDEEIARLKALAAKLDDEVKRLEAMRAENGQLRAQLVARAMAVFTPAETQALEEARERALRIECVNNLKQLGLAVRVWGLDNGDMSPPRLLAMAKEMSTPKMLVCPADPGRQPAADWSTYTAGNCSYEYLAPATPFTEPQRVLFRCPIHGNVTLMDGSVQSGLKAHPDWLVQRDGKLYFEPPSAPAGAPTPLPANPNPGQ